jgi:hypothetical protein
VVIGLGLGISFVIYELSGYMIDISECDALIIRKLNHGCLVAAK